MTTAIVSFISFLLGFITSSVIAYHNMDEVFTENRRDILDDVSLWLTENLNKHIKEYHHNTDRAQIVHNLRMDLI